ncbi:MAG: hypothetical protein ACK4L8_14280 [Nitrincola lacisaponensis]
MLAPVVHAMQGQEAPRTTASAVHVMPVLVVRATPVLVGLV